MNIVRVPPPFGTNMQSQNEFHLQTNSLFARNLHWTRGVTLNPGKRRWATAWIWMNPDCNWDDLFWVKSTSNFLQCMLNIWTHFKNSWKLVRYGTLNFFWLSFFLNQDGSGMGMRWDQHLSRQCGDYISSPSQSLECNSQVSFLERMLSVPTWNQADAVTECFSCHQGGSEYRERNNDFHKST